MVGCENESDTSLLRELRYLILTYLFVIVANTLAAPTPTSCNIKYEVPFDAKGVAYVQNPMTVIKPITGAQCVGLHDYFEKTKSWDKDNMIVKAQGKQHGPTFNMVLSRKDRTWLAKPTKPAVSRDKATGWVTGMKSFVDMVTNGAEARYPDSEVTKKLEDILAVSKAAGAPGRTNSSTNQSGKAGPSKEQEAKDQAAKDGPSNEPASKDDTAKAAISKDKGSKDGAAKGGASKDQTTKRKQLSDEKSESKEPEPSAKKVKTEGS
ncbi:hypothetical protein ANO11243_087270 [Dothideomycetidae sp. 11243]|nr:hypothetical protein ANO11243_087270 [fungal sp. No.11243]